MSDIPEGYYLGPRGEVLVNFRREPRHLPGPRKSKSRRGGVKKQRLRQRLLTRDGNLCHYCRKVMREPVQGRNRQSHHSRTMTVEHVVPRGIGGTDSVSNLVLACYECNHDRGDTLEKCLCDFCTEAFSIYERRQHVAIYA